MRIFRRAVAVRPREIYLSGWADVAATASFLIRHADCSCVSFRFMIIKRLRAFLCPIFYALGRCVPYIIECKSCRRQALVNEGDDPHTVLICNCCPEPHHHGQAAEDGRPCRPIIHYANSVVTPTFDLTGQV